MTEPAQSAASGADAAADRGGARCTRLFESSADGLLVIDADSGRVVDVNPAAEELLGRARDDLVGKTLWEFGALPQIAGSEESLRRLQLVERFRFDDVTVERVGRDSVRVDVAGGALVVDGRRELQFALRDVTSRRRAQDALRKSSEELSALVAELRGHDDEMRLLNHVNDLLQTCTTQDEAYRVIALTGADLFPGQDGCLAILHPWDQHLQTVASWGETAWDEATFALDDCWAMRRGQPHEVADPDAGLMCRHFMRRPEGGYLCVPLMVQGETLGLLSLVAATAAKGVRRKSARPLAVTVGEAIKLSLSNLRLRERLREQATHDPLTGLFNRRYLEDTLSREMHRARRTQSPLCVAMLDLDHFKQFNDTFGHEAGDALLRAVGQVLRERTRKSDVACRFGGEEFVVIFPDSSAADTMDRVEQIRQLIKGVEIRHSDQLLGAVSVSAGVAAADEHGSTARALLRAADDALYAAKQSGRDRVILHEPRR